MRTIIFIALMGMAAVAADPPPKDALRPQTELVGNGQKFTVKKFLGAGAKGAVYEMARRTDGFVVPDRAIKLLPVIPGQPPPQTGYQLITELSGGNIPTSFLSFEPHAKPIIVRNLKEPEKEYYVTVMEIGGVDLDKSLPDTVLSLATSLPDYYERLAKIEAFQRDGLQAIQDLSRLDIVHGDIKAANFVWVKEKGKEGHWKLADFDSAVKVGRGTKHSVAYASPEIFRDELSSKSSDAFSYSSTLYETMFGAPPLLDYIKNELKLEHPAAIGLIYKILETLTEPKKFAAFQRFIDSRFAEQLTKYPEQSERLLKFKAIVKAGVQADPAARVKAFAAIAETKAFAEQLNGGPIVAGSGFVATCLKPLRWLGLIR